jgi:uncharacterized protein YdhG (YjbR/CyaY superfamily)
MKRKAKTIDAYLAAVEPRRRATLEKLRRMMRALAPDAEESIRYGLPAFREGARIIGGFAATSKGCSYYPFSGRTLSALGEALEGYESTRGALHFDAKKGLPKALVAKLIATRRAEKR